MVGRNQENLNIKDNNRLNVNYNHTKNTKKRRLRSKKAPNDVFDMSHMFAALQKKVKLPFRSIPIKRHRIQPLIEAWETHFLQPFLYDLKINLRINVTKRRVELKAMPNTPDIRNLDKCAAYVEAFMLGFHPLVLRDGFFKFGYFTMSSDLPNVSDPANIHFRCVSFTPLCVSRLLDAWESQIYYPIRNDMNIDVSLNIKERRIELKTMPHAPYINNLDKCAGYVEAFILGFDPEHVRDAFLKYDHVYMSTINVEDVSPLLKGEHLTRMMERVKGDETKSMIEGATRVRILVADTKIHMVGSSDAMKIARDCLCHMIHGLSIPSVLSKLETVGARAPEQF